MAETKAQKKYRMSEKGIAARKRYANSEKGKAAQKRAYFKRINKSNKQEQLVNITPNIRNERGV